MVTPTSASASSPAGSAAAAGYDRHKKFYLCAAPRPPDFDALTASVLRGLGGSPSRAERVLQQTLDRIQNQHHWQRKSGPGRKSNAEHAIHFYEHVLNEIQTMRRAAAAKEHAEKEEEDDASIDESEEKEDDEDEDGGDEREEKQPAAKEEPSQGTQPDEGEDKQAGSDTSPAEKSAAVSNPNHENRSDECNVCHDTGGRLMVCSECGLAFHLPCVRPVMEEFPTDPEWRCAYCWLASEPKNSKKRRESAAAVRLMARLRNGNKRRRARQSHEGPRRSANDAEKNEKVEDTDEKESTVAVVTEANVASTGNADNPSPQSPNENAKKRKLALLKLADAFTGKIPSPGDDDGRGKRSRKQPTLYDPQVSVPARSWQSDEVENSDNSDSEDEQSENTNTRRTVADGEVYCSFCNDDSQVKLCCFCGCRKCFGKHKKSKLLICDECEEEYHTFCLSPPLDEPPSKKWFCPTCEKRGTSTSTSTTNSSESKTGRSSREMTPPAAPAVTTSPPAARKSSRTPPQPSEPVAPAPPVQIPIKRGRGRPPKNPEAIAAAAAKAAAAAAAAAAARQAEQQPQLKRKRGRPPKNASHPSQQVSQPPPRKRGRPPKNPPPPPEAPNRPKPMRAADGRFISAKKDGAAPSEFRASTASSKPRTNKFQPGGEVREAESTTTVVHVSRSGRAVKRTSFHDEIDEGEQHLRSERAFSENRSEIEMSPMSDALSMNAASTAASTSGTTTPTFSNTTRPNVQNAGTVAPGTQEESEKLPANALPTGPAKQTSAPPLAPNVDSSPAPAAAAQQSAAAAAPAARGSSSSGYMLPKQGVISVAEKLLSQAPAAAAAAASFSSGGQTAGADAKVPRRKPGARECVQISRRFGNRVIPEKYSEILLDYCSRGKVEHLIRMRERLDEHSRYLQLQLANLEQLVKEKGSSDATVPVLPEGHDRKLERTVAGGDGFEG